MRCLVSFVAFLFLGFKNEKEKKVNTGILLECKNMQQNVYCTAINAILF